MTRNQVAIDARIVRRSAVRYTPAGIPVIDLLLGHASTQVEAGVRRETRCEIEAVAIGGVALDLGRRALNRQLRISGFLAQHSAKDRRPVLHVLNAEPVGGETQ